MDMLRTCGASGSQDRTKVQFQLSYTSIQLSVWRFETSFLLSFVLAFTFLCEC